ncbi:unnamed protein product [Lathyrus sativus]|nr:unnamed protein product [Lathyrus sativus]
MADWSKLPKNLLQLISGKLNNELYSIRFQSVCSSCRSSSIPSYHHHHLSLKLPNSPTTLTSIPIFESECELLLVDYYAGDDVLIMEILLYSYFKIENITY